MKKKIKILRKTKSYCPECLKVLDSRVVEDDGLLFIVKECPEHGNFKESFIWEDKQTDETMINLTPNIKQQPNGLILNITSDCNMKCRFCYENTAMKQGYHLNIKDIEKKLKNFKGKLIYLSGGEPTTHKDFFKIVRFIKNKGYEVIVLSNGKMFSKEDFTKMAKKAGVDAVVIGLDSLNNDTLKFFKGEYALDFKLDAITNLEKYDIVVVLYVMCIRGRNLEDLSDLVRFAIKHNTIKRINFVPPWERGKRSKIHDKVTVNDILQEIKNNFNMTKKDFLEFSVFLHLIYDVLNKFRRKNINIEAICHLKIWFICFNESEIIPLNHMFDIKKMNIFLKSLKDADSFTEFLKSFKYFPLLSLIQDFKDDMHFRKFVKGIFKSLFFGGELEKLLPLKSINICCVPTERNIDLHYIETCNLYSDSPYNYHTYPTCIRQIMIEKTL